MRPFFQSDGAIAAIALSGLFERDDSSWDCELRLGYAFLSDLLGSLDDLLGSLLPGAGLARAQGYVGRVDLLAQPSGVQFQLPYLSCCFVHISFGC